MHLVYPPPSPKFCRTIVSNFSKVLQSSKEKSKTMVLQNFGVVGGGGVGRVNKLHYGLCENGEYKNNRACTHAVAILSPAPPVNLYQVSFHRLILSDFLVSFWKPAARSLLLSTLISSAHGSHSYPPGRFPLQN